MTRALRRSPWWEPLRRELSLRGLDPDDVVLIDALDDDVGTEAGLLATSDGRLIAWRREYDDDTGGSRMLEWRDVTDGWAGTAWGEAAATYAEALKNSRRA